MKTTYFCAYHADRIRTCEQSAMGSWNEMMRRGRLAYTECRTDDAHVYFGSATEIALLRYTGSSNRYFGDTHITKPIEFLVELLILENNFNQATALLSQILDIVSAETNTVNGKLRESLAQLSTYIKNAEKQHLKDFQYRSNKVFPIHPTHTAIQSIH